MDFLEMGTDKPGRYDIGACEYGAVRYKEGRQESRCGHPGGDKAPDLY